MNEHSWTKTLVRIAEGIRLHVQEVLRDGARVVFIIVFAHRRRFTFVAIHACEKMPTVITNIATCIAQVTLKLVHYAPLINQLLFCLTFVEVLANFLSHKY